MELGSYLIPTDYNKLRQRALFPGRNCSPDLQHMTSLETYFLTKAQHEGFPQYRPRPVKKHKSATGQAKELFLHNINVVLSMILNLSSQTALEADANKSYLIYGLLRVLVSAQPLGLEFWL